MVRMFRSLFCALLAVLVAMIVAPEPLAHPATHAEPHVASAIVAVDCGEASQSTGDHQHPPGVPCDDCCHHGSCHTKAPAARQADAPVDHDMRSVQFPLGAVASAYDAHGRRDPDPERT